MMSLPAVFWLLIIVFGAVGSFRGWAKEILVLFSLVLAIAIDTLLLQYVDAVRVILTQQDGITQLIWRSLVMLALAYFGYQTPNLPAFAAGKFAREKLQDVLLGIVLGCLNGYFLIGSLWYYMHEANYPIPEITAPTLDIVDNYIKWMPPVLLGVPKIYFAVIAAFVFVIIVFI